MKAIVRIPVAAVALMAVGLAGCADKHGEGVAAANGAASRHHEPNVRVLSQDQLEEAVVDAHDLPGIWVEKVGAGSEGLGDGVINVMPRTNTNPAVCTPVSAAVEGASGYAPIASVQRIVGIKIGRAHV